MYKIDKTISDIRLIYPGDIANRFITETSAVKVTDIVLEKPFKLQVTPIATRNKLLEGVLV